VFSFIKRTCASDALCLQDTLAAVNEGLDTGFGSGDFSNLESSFTGPLEDMPSENSSQSLWDFSSHPILDF